MLNILLFVFTITLHPKLDKVPRLYQNDRRNEYTIKNPLNKMVNCSVECVDYETFFVTVKPKSYEMFQLESKNNEQTICFMNDCQ
jgi:hypothetical protein